MTELEEILVDDWRSILGSVETSPSPLAIPPERRMPLSPVALFALLEETREEWSVLRGRLRPGDGERYVNAAWTLKDLIAHAASWAKEFRHEIETVARGGDFDYTIPYVMHVMGPTEWNEREVRARDSQSLDASFDEIDAETARLQNLLSEMSRETLYSPAAFPLSPSGDPAAKWRVPAAMIIAGKCVHDRHHLRQLKERLTSWHER